MTNQEQAYRALKGAILSVQLRPGEAILEANWAEQLGMSRTPVREALQRLEHEGLVTNEGRRGWFVYSLSLDDIRQIFVVEIALESIVARKAAELFDEACAGRLRDALEGMALAAEARDLEAWLEADAVFHALLFETVGNGRLERMLKELKQQMHRLRAGHLALEGRMQRSLEEHRAIARAILAHDVQEAEDATRRHLEDLQRSLLDVLEGLVVPLTGSSRV